MDKMCYGGKHPIVGVPKEKVYLAFCSRPCFIKWLKTVSWDEEKSQLRAEIKREKAEKEVDTNGQCTAKD